MKTTTLLLTLLATVGFSRCGYFDTSRTETIHLRSLRAAVAAELIRPYLSENDALSHVSEPVEAVTIRTSEKRMEVVKKVLAEYDVAPPSIKLHFQLIDADGYDERDPNVANVESSLRDVFKFRGYKQLAEARVSTTTDDGLTQSMGGFVLQARVKNVFADEKSQTLKMAISLSTSADIRTEHPLLRPNAELFSSTVSIPVGETVILGNAPTEGGAIILVVQPTLND